MTSATRQATPTAHPLTQLTVVLGPPRAPHGDFADFQQAASRGASVADHPWALHEVEALEALTHRDGSISTHTLLETLVGGVLQVGALIADVERLWVRHADGQLYAALTVCADDVRPRAAGLAFHDPTLMDALNTVSASIATLDNRAWMTWSSRTTHDPEDPSQLTRSASLVGAMAELVIRESPLVDAPAPAGAPSELALEPELLTAIRLGREHAGMPASTIGRELRALRHLDPMRSEWTRILMDAFYLGALDTTQLVHREELAGLAFLFVGKERTDRLKANPDISPRFRGELAAKTFMTAFALERLAPRVSAALWRAMGQE
jgi:hypothetical protein